MTSRLLVYLKNQHLFFPSARWTDNPSIKNDTTTGHKPPKPHKTLTDELTTAASTAYIKNGVKAPEPQNSTQFLSLLVDLDFPYYLSASDLVNFSFSCKAAVPFLRRVRVLARWTEEIEKAIYAGAFKHLQEVNLAGLGIGCAGNCGPFCCT